MFVVSLRSRARLVGLVFAGAVLAGAVLPGAGDAIVPATPPRPTWSAPSSIALAGGPVLPASSQLAPTVVFTQTGTGLVVVPAARTLLAPIAANDIVGSLDPVASPAEPIASTQSVALTGSDDEVVVGAQAPGGHASAAFGTVGGPLGPAQTLAVPGAATQVAVGADARDDLAVLARTCDGRLPTCADGRLYLVLRPAGHGFTRALLVGDRVDNFPIRVAVATVGNVLAVWSTDTRQRPGRPVTANLYSQQATARHLVGRPAALGPAAHAGDVTLALTPTGPTIVGWAVQPPIAGCPAGGTATIYATVAAPGQRLGRAGRIGSWTPTACGATLGSPGILAISGPGPTGTIAWQDFDGHNLRVRTSSVAGTQVQAAAYATSGGLDIRLDGLAAGPGGNPYLLWTELSPPAALEGGFLSSSGFAYGEYITGGPIVAPTLSFDPLTDHLIAAWGTTTSPASVDYAIRTGL